MQRLVWMSNAVDVSTFFSQRNEVCHSKWFVLNSLSALFAAKSKCFKATQVSANIVEENCDNIKPIIFTFIIMIINSSNKNIHFIVLHIFIMLLAYRRIRSYFNLNRFLCIFVYLNDGLLNVLNRKRRIPLKMYKESINNCKRNSKSKNFIFYIYVFGK